MTENVRTLSFVGVALASVAIAWFVHAGSQPEEPAAFAKVGTEFYPDFDDPTEAGSLEITNFDKQAKKIQKFKVELQKGRWRIPSHHGYPADVKDRLEKAAASLTGITRKAVADRRAASHERFGVLAPPETDAIEDPDALEGVGQRIVLKDKSGNVLADYILGKRVAGQDNLYFVRTPDEDETYHAEIDIDVSTKFSDWVETDLLKLDRNNLLSVELKTPKFEMVQTPFGPAEQLVGENSLKVHRDETGPTAKWITSELKPETEEINTSGIGEIQTGLDSLELAGVRPKPPGLTPKLTLDFEKFPKNQSPQNHFREMRSELASRGFHLVLPRNETDEEKFLLFGDGGELVAQSNEGLVYHLHFGAAFNGTNQEIEVGKTEVADEKGEEVAEPEKDNKETNKPKQTLSRFMFIRVEFDESLLGKAPTEPKEPQKPEGLKESPKPEEGPKDDAKKEKTPEELKQEQLQRDYESQLALYRNEKAAYEEDKKEYEEKLKAGKAKVEELNNRFGEWYYVIPATSYDNLTFTRADLVKEKTKDPMSESTTPENDKPSALDEFLMGESKPAIAEKPQAKPAND